MSELTRYSREQVWSKVDWEGGLPEGLEWFKPEEVPEEIEDLWREAREAWFSLDSLLSDINHYLEPSYE